jgi:hypothetical protein
MSKTKFLDTAEMTRLLREVPQNVRLDIVQLALDLAGIVNPAADAASGFISLLRGDLLGAAISAVSIFPIGDIAKLAKFQRYARSMETLVTLACRNYRLARALRTAMKQLDELLDGISAFMGSQTQSVLREFMGHLDDIRRCVRRYLDKMRDIDRFGVVDVARKRGKAGGQYVGHGDEVVSVNHVVDLLESAAQPGRAPAVRDEASEFLGRLAMSDEWVATAGIHRSGSDATRHITVDVEGIVGQFHLRVDKRGHLFAITHGPKAEPLSEIPR